MTRRLRNLLTVLSLLLLVGCAGGAGGKFTMRDARLLDGYGGVVAPGGNGPNVFATPVESIIFLPERRVLTDEDFASVFPAVRRMDPQRMYLDGHALSDRSIPLINRLRSLRGVGLQGTNVTPQGLRKLARAEPIQ